LNGTADACSLSVETTRHFTAIPGGTICFFSTKTAIFGAFNTKLIAPRSLVN
jgi:hypothetical protein